MSEQIFVGDLDFDVIFWKWWFELQYCEEVFEDSERSLDHLIKQALLQSDAKMKSVLNAQSDDVARNEAYWVAKTERKDEEEHFRKFHARYFRNNFLVSICAIFQSGASYAVDKLCVDSKKDRNWANHTVDRFEKEFRVKVLTETDTTALADAFVIRNCIAHDNSDTSKLKGADYKKTIDACRKYKINFDDNVILVLPNYIRETFRIVDRGFTEINGLLNSKK